MFSVLLSMVGNYFVIDLQNLSSGYTVVHSSPSQN